MNVLIVMPTIAIPHIPPTTLAVFRTCCLSFVEEYSLSAHNQPPIKPSTLPTATPLVKALTSADCGIYNEGIFFCHAAHLFCWWKEPPSSKGRGGGRRGQDRKKGQSMRLPPQKNSRKKVGAGRRSGDELSLPRLPPYLRSWTGLEIHLNSLFSNTIGRWGKCFIMIAPLTSFISPMRPIFEIHFQTLPTTTRWLAAPWRWVLLMIHFWRAKTQRYLL